MSTSEKSKFQKGFEPRTYRSAGKHANHTATEASLAMTYSIPLLTHCSCRHAIPQGQLAGCRYDVHYRQSVNELTDIDSINLYTVYTLETFKV